MRDNNDNKLLEGRVKRLEKELSNYKKSSEKFMALFDNAPLGIFRATPEGELIEINNTMAKMLGFSNKNQALENIQDLAEQVYQTSEERKKIIERVLASNKTYRVETRFKKRNGELFDVNLVIKAFTEEYASSPLIEGMIEDISRRKQVEKKLLIERNQLRALIDNIPDFVYVKDKTGSYVTANKAFGKLLNIRSINKIIGKKDTELFPESLAKKFIKDDLAVINSGKSIENVEDTLLSGLSKIKTYTTKVPLKDEKNNTIGIVGVSRNLTDLKEAQERINANRASLRAIIESTSNSIFSVNKDYVLVEGNRAFKRSFKEISGKSIRKGSNILDNLSDEDRLLWKELFDNCLNGKQWHQEMVYFLNGQKHYFDVFFNPILGSNNNISGVTILAQDITQRKITEAKIKENELRFRQLAENINDAFLIQEGDQIIYSNPAFQKIFGRDIETLKTKGEVFEDWIHPEDKATLNNRFGKGTNKTGAGNEVQYRIVKPDGKTRWIWTRLFSINAGQGKNRRISVSTDITEQKELELALISSRNQQKAILDNIPYLAWLKDNDGKYILVNKPFAEHHNKPLDEIIGKTDYDLCPKEKAVELEKDDAEVKKNFKRMLFQTSIDDKNWSETYKAPILDENESVVGITGITRDITSQKSIEDAIRESEERFRSLLQNSSDAISILNDEGVIIFESSNKNRITEFDINELIGNPIFDIVHPEDKEEVEDTFAYVKNNPNIEIKKEYRSLHKNKKWIYVESIFVNKLDNKDIKGIVVNSRDISERKRAELKERVYHSNLIFLSNSALDLLTLSDKDDIFKYIATRLHEYLENSMIIVCSYNENSKSFVIERTKGWGGIKNEILRKIRRDEREIELPILPIINDELFTGKLLTLNLDNAKNWPIGSISFENYSQFVKKVDLNKLYNISLARHNKILGNVTIITTHKSIIKFKHIIETFLHQVSVALHRSHLEGELIKAKEKAEESDKLKSAFLANMSHEIRTPMNGILGFAELLKEENISPGNRKKYIDIIDNNGKMLINLIDDIIDFSKIEADQVKIIKRDFSLNSLLHQVHSSFLTENLINNKSKVKLRMRKALSNDSCYINSDPNRLRQILTNLVGNALKFTDEGFIEFGYKIVGSKMLEFYVKDTGIGIPQEKIDQIFNRFIQADSSSTRKYGGSGLGLAISKGFVEILGGKMWAESQVGSGSTFYFTVPYKPAEKVKEKIDKPIQKKRYNWENRNILIAEDDKFSYKFLEGFLRQTNVNILHAENGKLAVDMCMANQNIDLVLMDIQMPEMNGYEATNLIKQTRKKLPVIAQTANAIIEEREKCFNAGCDDFVTKPVNIQELYSKIDKFFTHK